MRVKSSSASLNAPADAGEIVQRKLDVGGRGDRHQVQHSIGRTAERNDHGDGVFERPPRQHLPRGQPQVDQIDRGGARARAVIPLLPGNRLLGRAVGQAHAERFDGGRHGVGRIHPGTGPGPRNRRALHEFELLFGHRTLRKSTHRFKYRHDIPLISSGPNGAAVNEHCGTVEARQRHHAAGHVLVAAADRHHAVEALGAHHRFYGIGDDFARYQRITHAGRTHGNGVGYGNGIEGNRPGSRGLHTQNARAHRCAYCRASSCSRWTRCPPAACRNRRRRSRRRATSLGWVSVARLPPPRASNAEGRQGRRNWIFSAWARASNVKGIDPAGGPQHKHPRCHRATPIHELGACLTNDRRREGAPHRADFCDHFASIVGTM